MPPRPRVPAAAAAGTCSSARSTTAPTSGSNRSCSTTAGPKWAAKTAVSIFGGALRVGVCCGNCQSHTLGRGIGFSVRKRSHGSVGAWGGQPPWATRTPFWIEGTLALAGRMMGTVLQTHLPDGHSAHKELSLCAAKNWRSSSENLPLVLGHLSSSPFASCTASSTISSPWRSAAILEMHYRTRARKGALPRKLRCSSFAARRRRRGRDPAVAGSAALRASLDRPDHGGRSAFPRRHARGASCRAATPRSRRGSRALR